MAGAVAVCRNPTPQHLLDSDWAALMDAHGGPSPQQGVTLQPIFIPRQHSGLNRAVSVQQPGSPTSNALAAAAAGNADWAYLLRNAAALRNGSMSGSDAAQLLAAVSQDMQGRATSPHQIMSSPGSFLMASSAPQGMPVQQQHMGVSNSASGLFGSNSMMNMEALGQLSAEALASATGDPSNSFAMLGSGNLGPALTSMYGADGGVQTLYSSNDNAAAVAAAAAAAARATTTQSILQQQAAAAAAGSSLANSLGAGALAGLSNSMNLNSLMKLEESLSGTMFGPGGSSIPSPKPVSASLYIKNLPTDADKLFLYEKFSPYGAILSVKVLNDPQSGQCRGVGFVNFAEHISAVRSIQALHGTKVGDKLLHVSLQTPRLRATALTAM